MKTLINYVPHIPESVHVAERAYRSCKEHGLRPELRGCVWRESAYSELKLAGLTIGKFADKLSREDAVLANFITNYNFWLRINETTLILEHDVVVKDSLPNIDWPDVTNVGYPSFGQFKVKDTPGLYPLFSKPGYFPGAHAYVVTPVGAKKLVKAAKKYGAMPLDLFLSPTHLKVHEYWPWPVVAEDSFTTIQHEKGCLAKHNWSNEYAII